MVVLTPVLCKFFETIIRPCKQQTAEFGTVRVPQVQVLSNKSCFWTKKLGALVKDNDWRFVGCILVVPSTRCPGFDHATNCQLSVYLIQSGSGKGVGLAAVTSGIVEKVVKRSIVDHLLASNIVNPNRHGFFK